MYLLFGDDGPPEGTAHVPNNYRTFLRGRPALQQYFTRMLRQHLERDLVTAVADMLALARAQHPCTTDTDEDLARVEEVLARVLRPAVRALGDGVRADQFYRELHDAARDFLHKGPEDEWVQALLAATGTHPLFWGSAAAALLLASFVACLFY